MAVFESALTAVPTLVGWLAPVILLPASAISGLTAEQLEAILAHELAHVRRHDYLVNLLQTLVETLLFYHPAVWWLSRKIRQERELCCDDIAVELCGDRIAYARALATLEERRMDQPSWVMAASGGVLANRIRRVLGRPQPAGTDRLSLVTVLAAVLLVFFVVGRAGGPLDAASQPREKSSHEKPPSTAGHGSGSTSTSALAGRLEDANGAAIAGAHLCWAIWKTPDDALPTRIYAEAESDAEGRFRIPTPDSLTSATGSLPGDLWVLAPAKNVAVFDPREGMVTDGKAREWVVRLEPAKDLTLVVVDPQGQPLRNATVEPTNYYNPRGGDVGVPGTLRKRLVRTSDADGKVILPGLASDRLQGIVVGSNQFGRQRFFLKPMGASSKQTLSMEPVGRVEGVVTAPKRESVRGLVFTLWTIGPTTGQITGVATVTTDASGRFEVPAIARGTLMIDLIRDPKDAKPTLLPELPDRARVTPAETATINIPLAATVLVRGWIQTDDTHAPVPGALIAVVFGPTQKAVHVVSDEKGRFEARVLPGPVSNAVLTIPPAFRDLYQDSGQSPGNREIEVAAGTTVELPPIRLAPLKKFQGKVIDRLGRPFAEAELCADSKNRRYGFCKTNEHGEFSTTIPRTIAIDGYEIWVAVHARERSCKVIVEQQEPLVLRVTNWPEQADPPPGGSNARPAKTIESDASAGPAYDFHIVTTRGKPIAGAVVRPWAVGAGGGSFLITEATARSVQTDALGNATITLGANAAGLEGESMRTAIKMGISRLAIEVNHPDHPVWSAYIDTGSKRRVVLSDSRTIELRAHREPGHAPLTRLFPILSRSLMDGVEWREHNGVVTIRRVDLDGLHAARWLRVAHVPESGPLLFSDLIDLKLRTENPIVLDLALKPSVRVEGKLAAQVPRPVKNGCVIAVIIDGHDVWTNWNWWATAPIDADGRFVVESLPADENLQLIAYCDGWISASPTQAEAAAYGAANGFSDINYHGPLKSVIYPQLYRLTGPTIAPTVPMLRTAVCEVTVLDEDGRPLPNVKVEFLPAQQVFNEGSLLVGTSIDCLKVIREQLKTGGHRFPFDERPLSSDKLYTAQTNTRGLAVVSDLPLGGATEPTVPTSCRFRVSLEGYQTTWPSLQTPTTSVSLMPGQVGQIVVRLKKL